MFNTREINSWVFLSVYSEKMDRSSNTHQDTYKLPQKMFRPANLPLRRNTASLIPND